MKTLKTQTLRNKGELRMIIKLTATSTTLNGHDFDPKKDHKTVVAMMCKALGLSD